MIPIYHAGEQDGLLFVTMRYVDGDDLARIVAAETRLEPVRAAMLIGQVAAALDAAHARGLVHRDVKPANILIERSGELEHALLTDFGLTKSLQSDAKVTKTGTVIGTFDYTAPEQLESGAVDARTDVYALGCVLFQTLTGRVPFPRDSLAATMFAHFEAAPPSVTALVPEAPEALDRVVATAMAKDPARPLPVRRRPRARRAGGGRPAVAVLGRAQARGRREPVRLELAGDPRDPGRRRPRPAAERAAERDRQRRVRRPHRRARAPAGALRAARPPASARSCSSPASRASASRGWPPSSRARPTRWGRPCSTAATTPSRWCPTSRS